MKRMCVCAAVLAMGVFWANSAQACHGAGMFRKCSSCQAACQDDCAPACVQVVKVVKVRYKRVRQQCAPACVQTCAPAPTCCPTTVPVTMVPVVVGVLPSGQQPVVLPTPVAPPKPMPTPVAPVKVTPQSG